MMFEKKRNKVHGNPATQESNISGDAITDDGMLHRRNSLEQHVESHHVLVAPGEYRLNPSDVDAPKTVVSS